MITVFLLEQFHDANHVLFRLFACHRYECEPTIEMLEVVFTSKQCLVDMSAELSTFRTEQLIESLFTHFS
jgi:hypothetical protein